MKWFFIVPAVWEFIFIFFLFCSKKAAFCVVSRALFVIVYRTKTALCVVSTCMIELIAASLLQFVLFIGFTCMWYLFL